VSHTKIKVVFICSGNICRSPMAEAVFAHLVQQAGLADRFEISSAGTGDWHLGESPHPGTLDALRRHHVPAITGKRAQAIDRETLESADYVIALDAGHVRELRYYSDSVDGKLSRLLDYAPDVATRDVLDPYYNGRYEEVYQLVRVGVKGLLEHIRQEKNL
jgi:protein-tyrosine phosphatase